MARCSCGWTWRECRIGPLALQSATPNCVSSCEQPQASMQQRCAAGSSPMTRIRSWNSRTGAARNLFVVVPGVFFAAFFFFLLVPVGGALGSQFERSLCLLFGVVGAHPVTQCAAAALFHLPSRQIEPPLVLCRCHLFTQPLVDSPPCQQIALHLAP